MRDAGSTAPSMVSRTLSVHARHGLHGRVDPRTPSPPDGLQVFTDDLTAPPPDRARVRVINAAPPAPQLDVRDANAQPVALALPSRAGEPVPGRARPA